jgi:hypothetical protein
LKFAPDGTSSTFVTLGSGPFFVTCLAFDDDGNLFAHRSGSIIKIAPDGSSTEFAASFVAANSLAFANGVLFAGSGNVNAAEPAIVKFAPDGTRTTFVPGPLSAHAFAFEPVREKLRNVSARGLVGTGRMC